MCRIPPNGHPENKFIVSIDRLKTCDCFIYKPNEDIWEVQYDDKGKVGPPILQPNLYEYLQKIAYRVGRDIAELHRQIVLTHTDSERLSDQSESARLTYNLMKNFASGVNKISLEKIARDLHRVAPDLVEESQVNLDDTGSEEDCATIIQMQLIQESNNNWDSRFPENEHVWDFAVARLSTGAINPNKKRRSARCRINQYFSLRRWPLWAQSEKVRKRIQSSNLVVQENPVTTARPQVEEAIDTPPMEEAKRERYTGYGMPSMFPFGETPYQQAYQSWRIEQDLADGEYYLNKALQY